MGKGGGGLTRGTFWPYTGHENQFACKNWEVVKCGKKFAFNGYTAIELGWFMNLQSAFMGH